MCYLFILFAPSVPKEIIIYTNSEHAVKCAWDFLNKLWTDKKLLQIFVKFLHMKSSPTAASNSLNKIVNTSFCIMQWSQRIPMYSRSLSYVLFLIM